MGGRAELFQQDRLLDRVELVVELGQTPFHSFLERLITRLVTNNDAEPGWLQRRRRPLESGRTRKGHSLRGEPLTAFPPRNLMRWSSRNCWSCGSGRDWRQRRGLDGTLPNWRMRGISTGCGTTTGSFTLVEHASNKSADNTYRFRLKLLWL